MNPQLELIQNSKQEQRNASALENQSRLELPELKATVLELQNSRSYELAMADMSDGLEIKASDFIKLGKESEALLSKFQLESLRIENGENGILKIKA
ncbi:MAG: hypothetical protein K2X27_17390, partial [Candidatus Obscuribacterales bacterium]|nr:hypothetical protein [Candidatus Obscuribacterales bacterium]